MILSQDALTPSEEYIQREAEKGVSMPTLPAVSVPSNLKPITVVGIIGTMIVLTAMIF
jgi:hypothetical protein